MSFKRWLVNKLIPMRLVKRLDASDEKLRYALNEISELRRIVRAIESESGRRNADQEQTKDSFDYQWKELTSGDLLLGGARFDQAAQQMVSDYADHPKDWFKGKDVVDVGCGNGRWSHTLCAMGARVTAIEISAHALESVNRLCGAFDSFTSQSVDLLQPIDLGRQFDLVWCYGVLHHTGDTRRAFDNVVPLVKRGGSIFLMIYGEPRFDAPKEFREVNHYVHHRRSTAAMTKEERVRYLSDRFEEEQVHTMFDAVSPTINDLHRFDEIESWLTRADFRNIRTTVDSRNLHIAADRA